MKEKGTKGRPTKYKRRMIKSPAVNEGGGVQRENEKLGQY